METLPTVLFRKSKKEAILPDLEFAVNMSLSACYDDLPHGAVATKLAPGKSISVPTGVTYEAVPGMTIGLRPSFALASHSTIPVAHTVNDKNEIEVLILNFGSQTIDISQGAIVAEVEVRTLLEFRIEQPAKKKKSE